MMETNYEYMSKPSRAKRIVRNFTEVTLHDLKEQQNVNYRRFADAFGGVLMDKEGLNESAECMKYTDIACLIENMAGNETYRGEWNGYSYTDDGYQMFFYKSLKDLLFGASARCIPIRLFLNLPVRIFYKALWYMSNQATLLKEYQSFKALYARLGGGANVDRMTIEAVLRYCDGICRLSWETGRESLRNYGIDVLNAHKLIGELLVKSFKGAFPEEFCAGEVCLKYTEVPPAEDNPKDIPDIQVPLN